MAQNLRARRALSLVNVISDYAEQNLSTDQLKRANELLADIRKTAEPPIR